MDIILHNSDCTLERNGKEKEREGVFFSARMERKSDQGKGMEFHDTDREQRSNKCHEMILPQLGSRSERSIGPRAVGHWCCLVLLLRARAYRRVHDVVVPPTTGRNHFRGISGSVPGEGHHNHHR
jgi:hypothetical protein